MNPYSAFVYPDADNTKDYRGTPQSLNFQEIWQAGPDNGYDGKCCKNVNQISNTKVTIKDDHGHDM